MPQVKYEDLATVLLDVEKGSAAPVYLLHGDEYLYKTALNALLDAIVPSGAKSLNYESLEGESADVHEIIARLNTFPLLSGNKVLAVTNTNMFHSKITAGDLLKKAGEAFEKENLKDSARYVIRALSLTGMSLLEVREGGSRERLDQALGKRSRVAKEASGPWLDEVVEYCLDRHMCVPMHQADSDLLNEAITAGFPKTNRLVLTAELVDRRCRLYNTIKKMGLVMDCSVPHGDSMSNRRQQIQILSAHMRKALEQAGKTIAEDAFEALHERTGGSLRNFSNELGKLISFVGERTQISYDDVEQASEKTRQDPIYALTNAIGERSTRKSLSLVEGLLKSGFFPLQILSVAISETRRLILIRDFIRSTSGGLWRKGMSYGAFQKVVQPELEKQEGDLVGSNTHPFVVYNAFLHSENYTFDELSQALETLLDADMQLKTTGQDAKLVLTRAILNLCGNPTETLAHPAD